METFWVLLRKELLIQLRSQSNISSLVLYVLSTTFVVFTAFVQIAPRAWITLYWIIVILSSVNASRVSFSELKGVRSWYYYSMTSSHQYFFSKATGNFVMVGMLAIFTFLALGLFSGIPIRDFGLFALTNVLGCMGLALLFSFVSFLNVKVEGNSGLLPILSFPLLLPVLMEVIKLSALSAGIITDTQYFADIYLLIAIDILILALAILLIRYIWQS